MLTDHLAYEVTNDFLHTCFESHLLFPNKDHFVKINIKIACLKGPLPNELGLIVSQAFHQSAMQGMAWGQTWIFAMSKETSRAFLPESSAKVNGTFKVAITVNNEMIFMPYGVSLNRPQVCIGVPLV